jgi:hypothetical protein
MKRFEVIEIIDRLGLEELRPGPDLLFKLEELRFDGDGISNIWLG